MSFTTNIKNEISNNEYGRSETIAELSAIVNIGGIFQDKNVIINTENMSLARKIYKMIKEIYNIKVTLNKIENINLRKKDMVSLGIPTNNTFLLDTSLYDENGNRLYTPQAYLTDGSEEKKAYLRGIFLICGSINDPKTSRYHLEFVIENKKAAIFVNNLLNEFYFNSKVLKREKKYMVYIKEAEKIGDFIKLLNAYNSLFYYEDIRIYRDHKNMTNRLNNCEQANIDKILSTSMEQLNIIKKLKSIKDIEFLDKKIQELIFYKEKYPESSMNELAEIISIETGNKISKSGINHRFRKIKEILKESEQ